MNSEIQDFRASRVPDCSKHATVSGYVCNSLVFKALTVHVQTEAPTTEPPQPKDQGHDLVVQPPQPKDQGHDFVVELSLHVDNLPGQVIHKYNEATQYVWLSALILGL